MSVRERYKLSALSSEIEAFSLLVEKQQYDEAVRYFRANLEAPTLFGLEPSLVRAGLLQKIDVTRLTAVEDKTFVLYSLALTLNLTAGYPNRAIPLYEAHDELAERVGDYKSLSASLGHHAKALRQVGRFYESELVALKGLKIIRQRQDHLREAVNLYWLGMGLAHRGDITNSQIALERSLRIFKATSATQSEGVVNAFMAQRALWLGLNDEALAAADKALEIGERLEKDQNHSDLHGAVKILTAALRMKGEALVMANNSAEGESFLQATLARAREIEFVEEELPALRALALNALKNNQLDIARSYLEDTWHLADRGNFMLYNADSYNIMAQVEISDGNPGMAIISARKALELSVCDGVPFAYQRGLEDAMATLNRLGAALPDIPENSKSRFSFVTSELINPNEVSADY